MDQHLFFARPQPLTLREIATLAGATIADSSVGDRRIDGVAVLSEAGPRHLTFLEGPKYLSQLEASRAGACFVTARDEQRVPRRIAALRVANPYRAFVQVARELHPDALRPPTIFAVTGVSSDAVVHPTARLEDGVVVDPLAVIGAGAEIGQDTTIGAGAVIGPHVRIGRSCSIGANTTIVCSLVGNNVIVHPGCRIGQDGYGFVPGAAGHLKVPQTGRVIIQNDVEIGANTTIDRGALRDTVIGEGTKIDNLVQIAHNVTIGRHCIVVSQVGLSGSTTVGDGVALGARVGTNNHVTIGDGAQIAATSIVHGDVPPGAKWGGTPAKPVKQWFREMMLLERLAKGARDGSGDGGDGTGPAS
jgi:UDP-3-O-[3-hydroxymyristoyl] glucosamine N-acyltransferase